MTVSAGIGIANFVFDDVKGFWRWVALCDEGGVDSIWQSDRLMGSEENLECMSVMAALAGATRRIKFGMNVASLGLRDPVITAKACATIDVLSEGRLLPAFPRGHTASSPCSSVRMRHASSIEDTKTLPSPILPVLPALRMASTADLI